MHVIDVYYCIYGCAQLHLPPCSLCFSIQLILCQHNEKPFALPKRLLTSPSICIGINVQHAGSEVARTREISCSCRMPRVGRTIQCCCCNKKKCEILTRKELGSLLKCRLCTKEMFHSFYHYQLHACIRINRY